MDESRVVDGRSTLSAASRIIDAVPVSKVQQTIAAGGVAEASHQAAIGQHRSCSGWLGPLRLGWRKFFGGG